MMKTNKKIPSYIIKLEGNCNLSCSYCYYFSDSHRYLKNNMDLKVIKKLINEASEKSDTVELIWHGGEPLLAGPDKFNKILDIQDDICSNKKVIFRNLIQTNGTLVNKEWLRIFHRGRFGVSISLDGPEFINNNYRLYISGKSSYSDTIRGIRLIQDEDIKFSILSVVTKECIEYADNIYNFFVKNNIKKFDFLPCVEVDPQYNKNNCIKLLNGSLEKGDFSKFMVRIFDLWFKQNDPTIRIRYIENIISGLLGGKPTLCKFNGSCKNYITIDYDGTVSACDNFKGYEELVFGNIKENSLDEIFRSNKRVQFIENVSDRRTECLNCKYYKLCNGGCNRYSYIFNKNFKDKNFFCEDTINIFSHITNVLQKEHPRLNYHLV